MNVVKWKFPTFEDWIKNDKEWNGKLGEYNCSIEIRMFMDNKAEYVCAISTNPVPIAFYAKHVIIHSAIIEYGHDTELCSWYNSTIKQVQDEWEKYIYKTYIL